MAACPGGCLLGVAGSGELLPVFSQWRGPRNQALLVRVLGGGVVGTFPPVGSGRLQGGFPFGDRDTEAWPYLVWGLSDTLFLYPCAVGGGAA